MSGSSVHYKEGANVQLGKYHKLFNELAKVELLSLLQHLTQTPQGTVKEATKKDLFVRVLQFVPTHTPIQYQSKVYFSVEEFNVGSKTKRKIRARLSVDTETDYDEHRSASPASPAIDEATFDQYVLEAKNNDGFELEEEDEEEGEENEDVNQNEKKPTQDELRSKSKEALIKQSDPQDSANGGMETGSNTVTDVAPSQGDQGVHERYIALMEQMMKNMPSKQPAANDSRISKLVTLNPKNLKFDPEDGVGSFLTNIETAARGHRVTKDTDKIQMAVSSLSTSTAGFQLLGLVGPEEFVDWAKFKRKLYLMESANPESFSKKFKEYQRKPGQHVGQLMSRLKDYYKKSREIRSDADLDDRDIQIIRERFFDALEPALAGLGKQLFSERHRDPTVTILDSITQLVVDLELNFNMGIHSHKDGPVKLNNLFGQSNAETKANDTDISRLESMISQLSTDVKNIKAAQPENVQAKNVKPKRRSKLKGFCFRQLSGICPFGTNCRFNHASAPPDVVDFAKSLNASN